MYKGHSTPRWLLQKVPPSIQQEHICEAHEENVWAKLTPEDGCKNPQQNVSKRNPTMFLKADTA